MTNLQYLTREVLRRGPANSSCIEWPHYKNKDGYGEVFTKGKKERVHRIAYTLFFGEIPPGLEVDHGCRNRSCFNPGCLEAVTHLKNMQRSPRQGHRREMTHCGRGHEFTKENTYVFPDGRRCCKACRAVSFARFKAKVKEGGESDS